MAEFSNALYECVLQARASPIRFASTDLFVGPIVGRMASLSHLLYISQSIGAPAKFRKHHCLLVTEDEADLANGKLLVLGGSHRLLVSAFEMQIPFLPYQLVDFSTMSSFDEAVKLSIHGPLIVHHIESTEPRPKEYGFMEQVKMYGGLKEYWTQKERQRVSSARTRREARPYAMTQQKLLNIYTEFRDHCGAGSAHAIGFLDKKSMDITKKGYMSGADRLLNANVVDDLCYLESQGITKFSVSTLSTVKTWTIEKIKGTVALWVTRHRHGTQFTCNFHDFVDSEVGGKKGGRKRKQSGSDNEKRKVAKRTSTVEFRLPPPVWTTFLNWNQVGSEDLVQTLQKNVEKHFSDLDAKKSLSASEDDTPLPQVQGCTKGDLLEVLRLVRQEIDNIRKHRDDAHSFDLGEIVTNAHNAFESRRWQSVAAMVHGGITQESFTLWKKDLTSIQKLRNGTDDSVLFTVRYLNNVDFNAWRDTFIIDSLAVDGWWEILHHNSKQLQKLRNQMHEIRRKTTTSHFQLWNSSLAIIPARGNDHWSIVVLVNMSQLREHFSAHQFSKSRTTVVPSNPNRYCVFWLDSLNETLSPHRNMKRNLFTYLASTYPGEAVLTYKDLAGVMQVVEMRNNLQEGRDCAFYACYHISLVLRNHMIFMQADRGQVQKHIDACYRWYPFSTYGKDIQMRLRAILLSYAAQPGRPVLARAFTWADQQQRATAAALVQETTTQGVDNASTATPSALHKGSAQKKTEHDDNDQHEFMNSPPVRTLEPHFIPAAALPIVFPPPAATPINENDSKPVVNDVPPKPMASDNTSKHEHNSQLDLSPAVTHQPTLKTTSSVPQESPSPAPSENVAAADRPPSAAPRRHKQADDSGGSNSKPLPNTVGNNVEQCVKPSPASYPPIRQALTGVMHGILSLDSRVSGKKVISMAVEEVLRNQIVSDAIRNNQANPNLEVALTCVTPIAMRQLGAVRKNLLAASKTEPVRREPSPPAAAAADAAGAAPALQSAKPSPPDVFTEGNKLVTAKNNDHLHAEWMDCLRRAKELVKRMKANSEAP